MKVAIYARVSTKDQNVNTQLSLCREYCERMNLEIYKEYVDIGESGRKDSRPAFDEMLSDMRAYKFKQIIVYKIDRIGRSLQHLLNLIAEFQRKKVEFVSITQNIYSGTPEGKMFLNLMLVLAEYEREMTVNRVHAGLKRALKEGKTLGRPKIKVNKYEVLRLRNSGNTLREISSKLGISLASVQRTLAYMYQKDGVDKPQNHL